MKLTNTTDRRMSATNRKGMPIIIAPGESKEVDIKDEDYLARLGAAGLKSSGEAPAKAEAAPAKTKEAPAKT